MEKLLEVKNAFVEFKVKNKGIWPFAKSASVKAVNGISFDLHKGEILGIVGESGCGKSTLARSLVGLVQTKSGSALFEGDDLFIQNPALEKKRHHDIQMIFQDPLASLDPRMTVGSIIAEPLKCQNPKMSKAEVQQKVKAMMKKVGLLESQINRYAHEFSGGQCQRIGIARALIVEPKLLICDEPVSALDASIQAQIVNLLKQLQKEMGLSIIFIAHDLSIVKHISDRIMVMYLGHAIELGTDDDIYQSPTHPYTKALMSAVPLADPMKERNKEIELLPGDLPSPLNLPSGCVFRTRCKNAQAHCQNDIPHLKGNNQHQVACLVNQV